MTSHNCISPVTDHYLSAIRRRLEQLYDASAGNPRLREHLSDEVDWIDAQIEQSAAPTAWRWRAPGAVNWIYDPEPAWREAHKHEIELEPLYAASHDHGAAQAPTIVGWFQYSDYHGWQQVAKEFEGGEGQTALYSMSSTDKAPCAHAAIIGLDGKWHCQCCGDAIEMAVAQSLHHQGGK